MDQFELRVRFGSPTQAGKIDGKDYSVAGYFGSVDPVALMGMMIGGESRLCCWSRRPKVWRMDNAVPARPKIAAVAGATPHH